MIRSLLTVCTGNICRSPLAEAAFAGACPGMAISSAGLHALVGHDMDPEARMAALELGIEVPLHRARQFNSDIGREADAIVVMEKHHRDEIANRWPQFTAKTFLLGQFENGKEIPDPYLMGASVHRQAAKLIHDSVGHWAAQLKAMG